MSCLIISELGHLSKSWTKLFVHFLVWPMASVSIMAPLQLTKSPFKDLKWRHYNHFYQMFWTASDICTLEPYLLIKSYLAWHCSLTHQRMVMWIGMSLLRTWYCNSKRGTRSRSKHVNHSGLMPKSDMLFITGWVTMVTMEIWVIRLNRIRLD